ncbi:Transmembrane and coiled-coil domains protein 2-like protein [Leptotrombidium deliense]|uniref:Transmembrane and coiled-coil domains protein 2-like protein n=1 Tax=Leptotrombidium deliense TaxID=299467 RepID=A0A443SP90_9ACAR|nr:Transmembrane and coiled-coil domains protein 2-like protein [Leptotrombidium deliense]
MTSASNGHQKVGGDTTVDFLAVCRRMKRKKSPRISKRVGSVEGSTSSGASAVTPRQPTPPSTIDESRQSTQSAPGTSHSLPFETSLVASSPPLKTEDVTEDAVASVNTCNTCNECQRFTEELEAIKTQFQGECSLFHQSLLEERFRFERLEEQMNDLIELHQNEIENLKQGIVDMEEKVQYQSEERLRDIHEMLESCQTRISRMEHQQHQHFQQLVNLDSLENSNARALVLKLINVLLIILQVVLLLVATVANIVTPFLKTR